MLTVVKLGGSFAHFRRLRDLVAALEQGAGQVVVVPGGGPFANIVRKEQRKLGFDDATAHAMALLAMAEFGYALAGLGRLLAPVDRSHIQAALNEVKVPVWMPLELLRGDPEVPESWEMTSDSLAAWLAGKLAASRLIFMKRGRVSALRAATLVDAGTLDPLVPAFLAKAKTEPFLCGPRDIAALGPALKSGKAVGRRVMLA